MDGASGTRELIERIIAESRGRFPAVHDLAREVNRAREEDPEEALRLATTLQQLGGVLGLLQDDPEHYLHSLSGSGPNTARIEALIAQREAIHALPESGDAPRALAAEGDRAARVEAHGVQHTEGRRPLDGKPTDILGLINDRDIHADRGRLEPGHVAFLRTQPVHTFCQVEDRTVVHYLAFVIAPDGIGNPAEYEDHMVILDRGAEMDRDAMLRKLVDIHFARNDVDLAPAPVNHEPDYTGQ